MEHAEGDAMKPDLKKAERLRALATGMQKEIDHKLHPAISRQRVTARRSRIAAAMAQEGMHLEKVQKYLFALADHWSAGSIPPVFASVGSKKALEDMIYRSGQDDGLREALKRLANVERTPEQIREQELKGLERGLIGCKIPGYFPTPAPIAKQMVEMAHITWGMNILEPSAGKGDIANAIREASPDVSDNLYVIEVNHALRGILLIKGYKLIASDFMDFHASSGPGCLYDRIIANPPFEHGQDIDHVRHMWDLLKPGGKIVSIMCEGPFFRQDRKSVEFREWVDDKVREVYKLAPGAFLSSERPTGVACRIITLEKEK